MTEAHVATASEYADFKDQEVFLKQQFQASSSEKILLSEMVQEFFWGVFRRKERSSDDLNSFLLVPGHQE